MGDRAVIRPRGSTCGIYLHWHGSPACVHAFCRAAKTLGVRDPEDDPTYFLSRLTQLIANYIGGVTSIGIGAVNELDDSDNGTYVVGSDFVVVKRTSTAMFRPSIEPEPLPTTLTIKEQKESDVVYKNVLLANSEMFNPEDA